MATVFPGALDAFNNPIAGDLLSSALVPHATQHANKNDAIEAIEAKLGIGTGAPTANTVLGATGVGSSGWRKLVNADATPGAFMTKLAETTLAAPAGFVDFNNIPQTYNSLMILAFWVNDTSISNATIRLSTDGTTYDAGASYDYQYSGAAAAVDQNGEAFAQNALLGGRSGTTGNTPGISSIIIPHYTAASVQQRVLIQYSGKDGTASGNLVSITAAGWWRNVGPVRGIRFLPVVGNIAAASRFTLWGLPT